MQVLAEAGAAEVAALCDPDPQRVEAARAGLARRAVVCSDFDALLDAGLDGVVIATPNDLHEPQAAAAMERGLAVFSQKPLAVSGAGTRRLLELARQRNIVLGVDLSYRYLAGVPELKARIAAGELGVVTAAELCFHNAYGPDASWYYELSRAGGGCLLDLGCHLLDLCHWLLGARDPVQVHGHCSRHGEVLPHPVSAPEDFVMAEVGYAAGLRVHLSCSWRASAGRGALITCRVFGTRGGATIRNVGGSFYDFRVELHHGAESRVLAEPPDAWPGRALLDWAQRLASEAGGADLEHLATTAAVIDRIYGRAGEREWRGAS
jgi:predicted dehydrogenase